MKQLILAAFVALALTTSAKSEDFFYWYDYGIPLSYEEYQSYVTTDPGMAADGYWFSAGPPAAPQEYEIFDPVYGPWWTTDQDEAYYYSQQGYSVTPVE